jgi:5-methylcytosine-specific restriction endonuclease McrA
VTIYRLCPQCGALGPNAGLCPDCKRADNQRRNQKRRDSGRTSAAWQRLRLAALHRDGYLCQDCGKPGDRRSLTVHLDPSLEGQHWRASLNDLTTLCRSCHGTRDAPRAHAARLLRARSPLPIEGLREEHEKKVSLG